MGFAKYAAIFRLGLLEAMTYKFDVIFSSFGSLVYVFVFIYLWSAIYRVYSLPGFTLVEVLWYFLMVQTIRYAAGKPVEEITRLVQTGDIVNFVNKPFSLIAYQFFQSLGKVIVSLFSILLLGTVLLWVYLGPPKLSFVFLPLVLIAALAGITINFLINYAIATLAFWIEDATPFYWIYDKIVLVLGGILFPLELLPGLFQKIALSLPTAYYLYKPAKLFVHFSIQSFFDVITIQGAFIVVLLSLCSLMMYLGVRSMSINGG